MEIEFSEYSEQSLRKDVGEMNLIIKNLEKQLSASSRRLDKPEFSKKSSKSMFNSQLKDSILQRVVKELERVLNDKHDQLDDCQEEL